MSILVPSAVYSRAAFKALPGLCDAALVDRYFDAEGSDTVTVAQFLAGLRHGPRVATRVAVRVP